MRREIRLEIPVEFEEPKGYTKRTISEHEYLYVKCTNEKLRIDFQEEYCTMAAETEATVTIFSTGIHLAALSNAEQMAEVICKFLK